MIIYDKDQMPERIYIDLCDGAWSADKIYSSDNVEYVRADRYTALLEAAVSVNHHLFEITDTLLNRQISEREMADMIDDAQLALYKWIRFCDRKVEEA